MKKQYKYGSTSRLKSRKPKLKGKRNPPRCGPGRKTNGAKRQLGNLGR